MNGYLFKNTAEYLLEVIKTIGMIMIFVSLFLLKYIAIIMIVITLISIAVLFIYGSAKLMLAFGFITGVLLEFFTLIILMYTYYTFVAK